jgi:hypothetical protein
MKESPLDTMDLLATTALLVRLDELQVELNALEARMALPHSDQALLDIAWDLIVNEMDNLHEILALDEANQMVDPRDEDPYADYAYGDWYDPADEI